MKPTATARLWLLLSLLWLPGLVAPAQAAKCSGGANCTACKNCKACAHCAKRGGTCSVCRPDLYRRAPQRASGLSIPRTTPRRSTPARRAPQASAPRRTAPQPAAATIAVPNTFTGKIIGVSDGDTVTVLYQNRYPIKVRLYGVDAPESRQAYGTKAKQFTSSLAFGKTATIYSKGADRYRRVLGWVFVGSTCLNRELVANGYAWWYREYSPKEAKLQQLEFQARQARRGLWADPRPVAPWQFRRS